MSSTEVETTPATDAGVPEASETTETITTTETTEKPKTPEPQEETPETPAETTEVITEPTVTDCSQPPEVIVSAEPPVTSDPPEQSENDKPAQEPIDTTDNTNTTDSSNDVPADKPTEETPQTDVEPQAETATKADTVDAPIENPDDVSANPNKSSEGGDSIKDVDAAVDELLQDKELQARDKSPTEERAIDVDTTDGPISETKENRSNETEPETRGEDRSDAPKQEAEGRGDDSVDEAKPAPKSSIGDQDAQKDAMKTLVDEKTKLQCEFDTVKIQLDTLKGDYSKMEVEVETVNTSRKEQDSYIKSLETDITKLKEYEDWGKDNEQKFKDVQNKLTSLAEAEDAKNKMIQDLEKQLNEAKGNLKKAEQKIEEQEASGTRAGDSKEGEKSRTCSIM